MNEIFQYNPRAKYSLNGGQYLDILKAIDLFKQTVMVTTIIMVNLSLIFQNIFTHYPLGGMRITIKNGRTGRILQ